MLLGALYLKSLPGVNSIKDTTWSDSFFSKK